MRHTELILVLIRIFQTSSPSYVLMASINKCVEDLNNCKEDIFRSYVKELETLRRNINSLSYIALLNKDVVGKYDILLNKYHLQVEMSAGKYLLAMTSVSDTKDGFIRLYHALKGLDHFIGDLVIRNNINFKKDMRDDLEHNISRKGLVPYLADDKVSDLCIVKKEEFTVSKVEEIPLKVFCLKRVQAKFQVSIYIYTRQEFH